GGPQPDHRDRQHERPVQRAILAAPARDRATTRADRNDPQGSQAERPRADRDRAPRADQNGRGQPPMKSLFDRVKQKGEETFTSLANELVANERFLAAMEAALNTKGYIERKVKLVLNTMSV